MPVEVFIALLLTLLVAATGAYVWDTWESAKRPKAAAGASMMILGLIALLVATAAGPFTMALGQGRHHMTVPVSVAAIALVVAAPLGLIVAGFLLLLDARPPRLAPEHAWRARAASSVIVAVQAVVACTTLTLFAAAAINGTHLTGYARASGPSGVTGPILLMSLAFAIAYTGLSISRGLWMERGTAERLAVACQPVWIAAGLWIAIHAYHSAPLTGALVLPAVAVVALLDLQRHERRWGSPAR